MLSFYTEEEFWAFGLGGCVLKKRFWSVNFSLQVLLLLFQSSKLFLILVTTHENFYLLLYISFCLFFLYLHKWELQLYGRWMFRCRFYYSSSLFITANLQQFDYRTHLNFNWMTNQSTLVTVTLVLITKQLISEVIEDTFLRLEPPWTVEVGRSWPFCLSRLSFKRETKSTYDWALF